MRNSVLTVGHAYLIDKLQLQNEKNVTFNNGDMYLRTSITGLAGISELIDSNTKKEDGVSSWNGKQLETDIYMALEKIRIAYGTSALTGGTTNPALVKYSSKYADVPAALANADLVISQHGKDILTIPVQRCLSIEASDKPAGVADAYELDAFRMLSPKTDIGISIRFPKGASMSTDANHFLELHVLGAQTSRKTI